MVYEVLNDISRNCQKIQSVLDLGTSFQYEFIEPPKKAGIVFVAYPLSRGIFVNIALGLKMIMKTCSPTPIYTAFLVLDF